MAKVAQLRKIAHVNEPLVIWKKKVLQKHFLPLNPILPDDSADVGGRFGLLADRADPAGGGIDGVDRYEISWSRY